MVLHGRPFRLRPLIGGAVALRSCAWGWSAYLPSDTRSVTDVHRALALPSKPMQRYGRTGSRARAGLPARS